MSRFFRKMYAQCRLFVNKRETFYIQKCGENGIFAYKNRENDVFFPKIGTKIGLIREQGCLPMLFSTKGTQITTKPYVEIRKRYDVLCK